MRPAPAVLLATLVLLAGCGSAVEGTETYTPAPVPGGPTATPSALPAAAFPSGVGPGGVVDGAALTAAHGESLAGRSYRMVLVVERTTQNAGFNRTRVVLRRGPNATLVRTTTVTADGQSTRVVYETDTGRWVRCGDGGCAGGPTDPRAAAARTIRWALGSADTALAGRVRHDGRVHHRITADGNTFGTARPAGLVRLANYSSTALVGPSGLVSELRVRYVMIDGVARTDVRVVLQYTGLGETSVRRPDWVDSDTRDA